ncbi:MAG: 3-oxoacyl-ACP reductase FabG [Bdellovibrionales bacterium]
MTFWQNQVVLVTGASRGIGRELAIRFSALGAKVAINYVSNQARAEEVLALCNAENTRLYQADVGNEDDVTKMVEQIETDLGEVTILVNNAGQTRDGLLMMMSAENWKSVLSTHLDGAFYCSRAVMRGMVSNKFGRVINITSVSGIKGTAGQCNYSAAKAGLIGFTRALSREMGRKKITCNAVALGVIDTEMTQDLSADVLQAYKDSTSLKRFGQTSEVADLVEFLASDKSNYLTGQVITLDGGLV